jgi:hypothetical protein
MADQEQKKLLIEPEPAVSNFIETSTSFKSISKDSP